jgi:hypothetical protein
MDFIPEGIVVHRVCRRADAQTRLEESPPWSALHALIEKRLDLVLQQALLDRVEKLFGLPEGQAPVLATLGVFLSGDNVSNGFFVAIITVQDELEFNAHGRAPPGLRGRCMMPAILPESSIIPSISMLSSRTAR